MSLYNALFGVNPHTPMLLSFLGLTPDDVPRFRDCYVEDGKIIIYTRTGGGNRSAYERDGEDRAEYGYDGPTNDDLREAPGFISDEDDAFDCTYATFTYEPGVDVAPLVAQLSAINGDSPADSWRKLFADMDANRDSPRAVRALEVGKPIIEALLPILAPASADRSGEAMETRSGSTEGESAVPCEDTADAQGEQP